MSGKRKRVGGKNKKPQNEKKRKIQTEEQENEEALEEAAAAAARHEKQERPAKRVKKIQLTHEHEEVMIIFLKEHSVLYDYNEELHADREHKDQLWAKQSVILNETFNDQSWTPEDLSVWYPQTKSREAVGQI